MTLLDLGNRLKDSREKKGLSIDDIAEKIKVSVRILRLIEEGNDQGLPHAVYARGFITSYAEVLDLDKEELMENLNAIFPADDLDEMQPGLAPLLSTRSTSGSIKRALVLIVLVGLLVGVVGGGWWVIDTYGGEVLDIIKQPFSAVTTPVDTSTPESIQLAEPEYPQQINISSTTDGITTEIAVPGTAISTLAGVNPTEENTNNDTDTRENSNLVVPASSTTSTDSRTSTVGQEGGHTAELRATGECWVRVHFNGAESFKEFTLHTGEKYSVEYTESVKIFLGNPAVVSVYIDGEKYEGSMPNNKPIALVFPQ